MSRDPQPAVAEVVVNKENVSFLEGNLVRVWHLGVGQDRHHPLLVIHRLRWWNRKCQSLMFQKVAEMICVFVLSSRFLGFHSPYVGVVANKILKTVKLPSSNVIITTHRRNPEEEQQLHLYSFRKSLLWVCL